MYDMDPAPPRVPQTAAVIRTGTPPNWLRNSIAIKRDSSSRQVVRADAICLCAEVAVRRRHTYIAAGRRWDMRQIHWLFPLGLAECVETDTAREPAIAGATSSLTQAYRAPRRP
jgi:hypothetical protein